MSKKTTATVCSKLLLEAAVPQHTVYVQRRVYVKNTPNSYLWRRGLSEFSSRHPTAACSPEVPGSVCGLLLGRAGGDLS
jgi:hypothetical protein